MSNQIRFSYVAAASLIAGVLIALLATQASRTAASADATVKIAVIDTEKILLSSVTGKGALASMKKLQETLETEIKMMQQEIKDLQTKIQDGRQSLSPDQLAQLQKQLDDKLTALRRKQDDSTRDLNKKRDEVLGEIDKKVMPVLNQIGKEMGYTAIFRKFESGLIYADDAIDITALVIQRLDTGGFVLPPPTRPGAPTGAPTSSINISADGNVGIGTASPIVKLHSVISSSNTALPPVGADVGFAISNSNTTANNFEVISFANAANGGQGQIGVINLGSTATAGGHMFFSTRPAGGSIAERMRISSAGDVGIGTSAPDQKLSVNGDASKTGGGSWQVFSDARLKNIKGRFNSGLSAVMQLQPLRYEYKRDNVLGLKAEGEYVGFAAQDLRKIIPEAVSRSENGFLMVNNDPILWTMLNAIKAQQKQIAELKGQVRNRQLRAGGENRQKKK